MISKNRIILKLICFLILAFVVTSCLNEVNKGSEIALDEYTKIKFNDSNYNFGKINRGKNVFTIFKFLNVGKKPLLIYRAVTNCGCTVVECYKGIIKPNECGKIKVIYDAKFPGRFNKSVTVFYNGKDSPIKLTIKGDVPYPK